MDYNSILSISTTVVSFVIGFFIVYKNPKNKINLSFAILTFSVAIWILTNFLADIASTPEQALFWARLTLVTPVIGPFSLLFFSRVFPIQTKATKLFNWIILSIPAVVILFLVPTKLNIEKVTFTKTGQDTVVGPLYTPFAIYFLVYLGLTFFNFFLSYKKLGGFYKYQIRYLFLGITLFFLTALTTNAILPLLGFSYLVSLGPLSALFFLLSVSYAIVKHRLLDIRLVVARTIAYSLLLGILSVFYIGSTVLLTNYLIKTTTSSAQLLLYTTLTLLVAFTFQPLRKFLEKSTDKIFFKQDYDSNQLLSKLTKIMASTILIDDIAYNLLGNLIAEMRITRGAFVLTDAGKIFVSETQGYKEEPSFSEKDVFSLQALDKNLVFEEVEEGPTKELMRKLDVTIVIPLKTQVDHIGLLFLGEKASGEIYSTKDISVLKIFAPEAAISFENAKSVEKIRRFNITLKEQVERATHELKDANEQLKSLDKLKDEFLSIASHDLRTPMTAIRSYLWMVLNGRAGEIKNPTMKRYLDISYSSSERMIALINDLLNVSRIEAGRVEMNFEEAQLKPIVDQVFAEIKSKASEKAIELKYDGVPKLPFVVLDKQRFPEILQNLIGNAIKFTPEKGTITVSAKPSSEKGFVEIAVSDTGVGLSEEDQEKLFRKYGRLDSSYTAAASSGGTGLGLYITKNYVELHGGKIWVESKLGKGTTFKFTLHQAGKDTIKDLISVTQTKQTIPVIPPVKAPTK